MKRATITIPDELNSAVERYIDAQDAPPSLTAVVQAALRRYMADEGYLRTRKRLRPEAAVKGSAAVGEQRSLEAELIAGLNSGEPITMDDSYWEAKRANLIRGHAKRANLR